MSAQTARSSGRWRRALGLALATALGFGAWGYVTLPDVDAVVTRTPATTALIEARGREAAQKGRRPRRRQSWVPLSAMAPSAVDAILVSEDARFYQHDGLDYDELRSALRQAVRRGKLGRGASTLTQQVVKNLWLSGERSLVRKGKEMLLARRLERAAPKKRILALYLNIAEWGDGVYGIEAAAQEHFGVHASELSPAQGIILASMLPAPRRWTPAARPAALRVRAFRLLGRLRESGKLGVVPAYVAHLELETRLGLDAAHGDGDGDGDGGDDADEGDPD